MSELCAVCGLGAADGRLVALSNLGDKYNLCTDCQREGEIWAARQAAATKKFDALVNKLTHRTGLSDLMYGESSKPLQAAEDSYGISPMTSKPAEEVEKEYALPPGALTGKVKDEQPPPLPTERAGGRTVGGLYEVMEEAWAEKLKKAKEQELKTKARPEEPAKEEETWRDREPLL